MHCTAAPDAPLLMAAQKLRISYPKALGGFKGWFKKGEFVAVQQADLHLPRGQTLGVIGESGSGKSTLALALLGLLPAGSMHGQVFYKQKEHIAGIESAQSATKSIVLPE